MEGYITAREAAENMGYEYTYFTRLLKAGRVPGAVKFQQVWMVPVGAEPEPRESGRPVEGYVYIVRGNGWYKIGRSKDARVRTSNLAIVLPFEIEVVRTVETSDTKRLEGELHRRFADRRIRGEWFDLTEEDLEYIRSL